MHSQIKVLAVSLCAVLTWGATPLDAPEAPVAEAAMSGDVAGVRALIEAGEDVDAALGDGMTALHWAAERGDVDIAALLLSAGAQLESTTRLGAYRPLHLAAKGGHSSVVRALLDAGAVPGPGTTTGDITPLHLASASGDASSVIALIEHGADVDRAETSWGQTALMFAAAAGRVQAIRALLDGGADVDLTAHVLDMPTRDSEDREDLAERRERVAALRIGTPPQPPVPVPPSESQGQEDLAAQGGPPSPSADVGETQQDRETEPQPLSYAALVGGYGGLSAILLAVREGHSDAAMALLDGGADINRVSDGDHTSPLLMAVINGHFDLAMELFERGADPNSASDAGATPLYGVLNTHWIPKSRHPQPTDRLQQEVTYLDLMRAFLDAGVDPNVRLTKKLWFTTFGADYLGVDRTGATPFWRAAYALDIDAMKLLVSYGADPHIPTAKVPTRRYSVGRGEPEDDPSGLPPVPIGGPGVWPIHAASGAGYGEGYAANIHRHVPDGWLPAVQYLVDELGADVSARDLNGYHAVHHAASRGDNEMILFLVDRGADVTGVSRRGQTTVDMANSPEQRITPFPSTISLLEGLGAKNNHSCVIC